MAAMPTIIDKIIGTDAFAIADESLERWPPLM